MRNMQNCPDCNGALEYRQIDKVQGMFCNKCGWNVVTSFISELEKDNVTYKVYSRKCDKTNPEQIKAVSECAGVNFIDAKKLLESEDMLIIEGKAGNIVKKISLLSNSGVKYYTKPDYPHKII